MVEWKDLDKDQREREEAQISKEMNGEVKTKAQKKRKEGIRV